MRALFFGTDDVALATLRAVLRCGAVSSVTVATTAAESLALSSARPDRSRAPAAENGLSATSLHRHDVARFAQQEQLATVVLPPALAEFAPDGRWDVGVVASFGHKLPAGVVLGFPRGMINMHPSLLPRFRGAAPIARALWHGDAKTGVTVQEVHPTRMDCGRILLQREVALSPTVLADALRAELADLGAQCTAEVLADYDRLRAAAVEQVVHSPEDAVPAPKLTADDALAAPELRSARELYNQWRALYPRPGLSIYFHHERRKRVKLLELLPPDARPPPPAPRSPPPGAAVLDPARDLLWLRCAEDSWLPVQMLQMDSKPPLSALSFYSGYVRTQVPTAQWFFGPK